MLATEKNNFVPLDEAATTIDNGQLSSQKQQKMPNTSSKPGQRCSAEGNLKLLNVFELPSDVMCSRFNPDGVLLAIGLSNGIIKIYSIESKTCVYSIPNPDSELPVTCLRWRPDLLHQSYGNVLTATYASGEVRQWHVSSGKCLWTIKEERQALTCSIGTNGERFLTAGSDAKINLYDSNSRKLISTFESSTKNEVMDGHTMRIFVAQFHPANDNIFVSGGWDDTVQWWDARQDAKHSIRKIIGPHICGEGLDIEPSSLNIVTGSWRKEKNIQVWDFASGQLVKEIPSDFNRSMVYCVQWKNSESILVGGSHCNMMRIVNRRTLQTTGRLMDLPGAVYTIDNNRHGIHPVVAIGSSEFVYLVQGK
eukprot:gene13785-15228_t